MISLEKLRASGVTCSERDLVIMLAILGDKDLSKLALRKIDMLEWKKTRDEHDRLRRERKKLRRKGVEVSPESYPQLYLQ